MSTKILRLKGREILPYIDDLAKLRITVFRDYPYLYDGNFEYEQRYLSTYVNSSESTIVLALDGDQVVGASTALPLNDAGEEFTKVFLEHHLPAKDYFYLGESVLLPSYRGKGVYQHFFHEREAAAKERGYAKTAFCAVKREDNDPRRPKDYVPLDKIWQRYGYVKHPEVIIHFPWKEIDETEETLKPLVFWLKDL